MCPCLRSPIGCGWPLSRAFAGMDTVSPAVSGAGARPPAGPDTLHGRVAMLIIACALSRQPLPATPAKV